MHDMYDHNFIQINGLNPKNLLSTKNMQPAVDFITNNTTSDI